jgi:hypothetical protein
MKFVEREAFEKWYAENAFNYGRDPIGSRECGLQWSAWQGRAHLAQPAQAVDVGIIREVAASIDLRAETYLDPQAKAWANTLARALSGEKAGPAGEWESAFHAQRAAAMRAHTICYETMLARPDVAELGDDGRLHDAIHDILRVDGPASPAPDKEGM